MLTVTPLIRPPLDPDFLPAALWNRAFRALVSTAPGPRPFALFLERVDGGVSRHDSFLLPAGHPAAALNRRYAERLLKFLLWQQGAFRVLVAGADEIARHLAEVYSPSGARRFDCEIMGAKIQGRPFSVEPVADADRPTGGNAGRSVGRHLDGCRIGFDLGGSDRKAAALIDGRVVFSEEIAWDPYFQSDPAYHLEGIHDSLLRAAAHLPRVDAIGGSAAGVYVNNEPRVASLFRGVPPAVFDRQVRPLFSVLRQRWGGVPFVVVNDGEVTALAGAMALDATAVLGVSMGTSQAGGYVTPEGGLTPWLNELAFAPVDYRPDAPRDEWSGDAGCGVQYFSQQGVARLAQRAGFAFAEGEPPAARLTAVQAALETGDARAAAVFDTLGVCFGYAIAHYADFYRIRHLLTLGRVLSGPGGERLLAQAAGVLRAEFPTLAGQIAFSVPSERDRRHGQAIAAASLPVLQPTA
jgi:predicted NBD/HSP70 family sugar kinase